MQTGSGERKVGDESPDTPPALFLNKLLSYAWEQLTQKEQALFASEREFAKKQALFFKVSRLNTKLQSLHAKLKVVETNIARKDTAAQIIGTDQERSLLWAQIDGKADIDKPDTEAERAALKKQYDNYTSNISRTKKKIKATIDDTKIKIYEYKIRKWTELREECSRKLAAL